MANIPLQSITFPGLSDKYTTPTVDATLTQTGAAADAKKTGDEIGAIKNDLNHTVDKEVVASKNLINPEALAVGKFIENSGSLADLANYTTTDFIPITSGQKITVSPKCRAALFFDVNKAAISNTYYNENTLQPVTFTASADGYFRVSVFTSDNSIAQAEYGDTATPYTPYEERTIFENGIHLSDTMVEDVSELINATNGSLSGTFTNDFFVVSETVNNKNLTRRYVVDDTNNDVFNFHQTFLDNTVIKNCNDDITPQRLRILDKGNQSTWTVGANHGWMCYRVPKGSLEQEDCGSVWTDGTENYTLMVVNNSYAFFALPCSRSGNYINVLAFAPSANLTHVSGATHTSAVSISSGVTTQFYPAVNNRTVDIYADGVKIDTNGSVSANKFNVVEHYEIMDYVDMVSVMQNNIGASLNEIKDTIATLASLDYNYEITSQAEVVYTTLTAKAGIELTNSGFMQADPLTPVGGTLFRYANGIKDGNAFASSSLHDMTNYNETVVIHVSDLIDESKPTNRTIDFCVASGQILYGFAIGFIPDMSYGADAMRKNANFLWEMRNSKKIYPACITDKTLVNGESVGVIGYRHYIVGPQEITNKSVVDIGEKEYVFIDAHGAVSDVANVKKTGANVIVVNSLNLTAQDFVGATGIPFTSSASYSSGCLKVV